MKGATDDVRSFEPSSSRTDGLASRLSTAATTLFRLLLAGWPPQQPKPLFRALEREYGCLLLWCNGYGLSSGDLDAILADSKRLRNTTLRLLMSISHSLTDRLAVILLPNLDGASRDRVRVAVAFTRDCVEAAAFTIDNGDDPDSENEDDNSEAGSSLSYVGFDVVEEVISDLRTDTQCLVALGPRYAEPIRDRELGFNEAALAPQHIAWDPALSLVSRIRQRYPHADDEFAHILGELNWARVQRLMAAREENAQKPTQEATRVGSVSRPPGTVMASEFHDSGLGTSIPTVSQYAETVFSYHGTAGGSIKIPSVPERGLQGLPFDCPLCGCSCQLPAGNHGRRSWKQHVISDLQPYVCVIPTCGSSRLPFPDKKTWLCHLELEHNFTEVSAQMKCPLCQERAVKTTHLMRHLEEISLTILPASTESDGKSDEGSEASSEVAFDRTSMDSLSIQSRPGQPPAELLATLEQIPLENQHDRASVSSSLADPDESGRRLWCEFMHLVGCSEAFHLDDELRWIGHHVSHMNNFFPHEVMCWFCDQQTFTAGHLNNVRANFERRMLHIREHILGDARLSPERMRPDFPMIQHLHDHALLDDGIYHHAMSYSESPEEFPLPRHRAADRIKCKCRDVGDVNDTVLCKTCRTRQHIACYYPGWNAEQLRSAALAHSCADCLPKGVLHDLQKERRIIERRARAEGRGQKKSSKSGRAGGAE